MPDWIGHFGFAYLIAKVLRTPHVVLVLIGAIIPDLVRVWNIVELFAPADRTISFMIGLPFHSLLFGVFLTVAISAFFIRGVTFRERTLLMGLGMGSHLLLDATMQYTIAGVRLLIPFSYGRIEVLNILPSQDPLPAIILGSAALIVFLVSEFRKRKK